MKGKILTLICATALLSSCHIYKTYDRPDDIIAEGLYRDTVAVNDTLVSDTANSIYRSTATDTHRTGSHKQS